MANGPTYLPGAASRPEVPPGRTRPRRLTSPRSTTPEQLHDPSSTLLSPFPDFNYVVAFSNTAPGPERPRTTGANYQLHPMSHRALHVLPATS